MYDMKNVYSNIADKVVGIKDGVKDTYHNVMASPKKAAGIVFLGTLGALVAKDLVKPTTAEATPFLNWGVSQSIADYNTADEGLESLFQYSGTNVSDVADINRVSTVVFDFGSNDGVYDAGLDLEGWSASILGDSTVFSNDSGMGWNPGLFNEATFSLYGLGVDIGDGSVVGYNRLGDASNITDVTGPAAAPVPEPATLFLMGTGLLGLAGATRKKWMKK